MATAKKSATKKAAKKKATKAAVKRMAGLIGYDARNGAVTMMEGLNEKKVNGYWIENQRTGYKVFEATRTAALALYNAQINSSQRQ